MRSALLLGLLALCGCASAPGYRSSAVAVPPAFREVPDSAPAAYLAPRSAAPAALGNAAPPAAAAAAATAEYWERLGDTTLLRLIREVRAASPAVQAARARLGAARSERTRAVLELTPSIPVSGGYVRQRISSASFPGFGTFPDQDIWSASVDPFWELDVFGRIRHDVQGRGALVGAAREDVRDAEVTLTAEVARAYFELRGAQEQLGVARRNAENQRHTFEVTRTRLEAGRGSAFDTERAQAQLSSTLATIPGREAAVAQARYRIAVLVGRSPDDTGAGLAEARDLPALPEVTTVPDPRSVVRDRPDVAAAERQAAARQAFVGAAKASYLPRITFGGSVGYAAPRFRSFGDQGAFNYVVGPVISWPALNLGRVKAEVDAAQAHEAAARAQYDQAVLSALGEIESALTRYRAARIQVERLREASAASERAAELARLRFQEGVVDLLQVLEAERTQLEAQDRLTQGRVEAATAYAALYRALGGP